MATTTGAFERLTKIDVTPFLEQKGNMTYLPWAKALELLRRECPDSTWEFRKFGNGDLHYSPSPAGAFVETSVTVDGLTLPMVLPVLDHAHKAVAAPDAFQVNTALMRCLTKNIAVHGLGLSVYVGEDIPNGMPVGSPAPAPRPAAATEAPPTGGSGGGQVSIQNPDAPMSERQEHFLLQLIAKKCGEGEFSNDNFLAYAAGVNVDVGFSPQGNVILTKGEASTLIEHLKNEPDA